MQKELLDTELDLYKKMQAGEEVTELRRKYTELQLEVCFISTTQYAVMVLNVYLKNIHSNQQSLAISGKHFGS